MLDGFGFFFNFVIFLSQAAFWGFLFLSLKPLLASNLQMFWGCTIYQNLIRSYFSPLLEFVELSLAVNVHLLYKCSM